MNHLDEKLIFYLNNLNLPSLNQIYELQKQNNDMASLRIEKINYII